MRRCWISMEAIALTVVVHRALHDVDASDCAVKLTVQRLLGVTQVYSSTPPFTITLFACLSLRHQSLDELITTIRCSFTFTTFLLQNLLITRTTDHRVLDY